VKGQKSLLYEQEKSLSELFVDHKQELESLVHQKRNFRQKPLQKQYEFNETVLSELYKVKKYLKKGDCTRSISLLKSTLEKLEEKSEDLQIADQSPFGWLAVSMVRKKTELPKDLQKRLEKVNKQLEFRTKVQRGGHYRPKYGRYQYQRDADGHDQQANVRVSRNERKSPQDYIQIFGKQKKTGICSHCEQYGHFYRECPAFWRQVQETRKENGSGSGTTKN
jgi:hypothetical protein